MEEGGQEVRPPTLAIHTVSRPEFFLKGGKQCTMTYHKPDWAQMDGTGIKHLPEAPWQLQWHPTLSTPLQALPPLPTTLSTFFFVLQTATWQRLSRLLEKSMVATGKAMEVALGRVAWKAQTTVDKVEPEAAQVLLGSCASTSQALWISGKSIDSRRALRCPSESFPSRGWCKKVFRISRMVYAFRTMI